MMKKVIFMVFMGINIALAEESGGFIGLEVGYGEAEIVNINSAIGAGFATTDGINLNGGGVAYGFAIGYKQFFTPYFGLRYYANFNALHAMLNITETPLPQNESYLARAKKSAVTLLNYGANIDFMANVLASENADLGGFVGVGIGGDLWLGKGIDYQLALHKENNQHQRDIDDWKLKNQTIFNVWINVGLRTNIAKYHSIELVARAPLLKAKLLDDKYNRAQITIKGIYSISARYVFSF